MLFLYSINVFLVPDYIQPCPSRGAARQYPKAAEDPVCGFSPRSGGMATPGRAQAGSAAWGKPPDRQLRYYSCRHTSGESLASERRGCVAGGLGDPAAHRCGCVAAGGPDRRPNEQSRAVQGARCCHGCLAAYPGSRDSNKSRVSDPVIRAHVQAPVLTCGFEISCQAPPSRCLKRQKYVPVKYPESDSKRFAAI